MDERRKSYRISENLEGIRISMVRPCYEPVETRLLDLSAKGAAVVVSASATVVPPLPAGTVVHLSFMIPGLEPLTGILSIVKHERHVGRDRVVAFEIEDWMRLHEALPSRLFAIFNRRRHVRVDVFADPPIEVSVRTEDESVRLGHLADISASGCALIFSPGQAPAAEGGVCLSFQLPEVEHPFHLGGDVRSRNEVGKVTRWGIEFRKSQLPGFIEQEQSITDFVARRLHQQSPNEKSRNHGVGST